MIFLSVIRSLLFILKNIRNKLQLKSKTYSVINIYYTLYKLHFRNEFWVVFCLIDFSVNILFLDVTQGVVFSATLFPQSNVIKSCDTQSDILGEYFCYYVCVHCGLWSENQNGYCCWLWLWRVVLWVVFLACLMTTRQCHGLGILNASS